ncbi:MAG: glycosyltransferase [Anaerolineae bacterium]|nr:glycosyltransferase [Anaerolineae bacterium]
MDILLISRCPPFPIYHGDRLIPYHLARELSARGNQIDLLAFYQSASDLADVPRYSRLFRDVKLIREPQRTPAAYFRRSRNAGARFPTSANESWSPEMWNAIKTMLDDRTYSAVHFFGGIQVYEFRHLAKSHPKVIVPYESYSLWLERAVEDDDSRLGRWFKQAQLHMARNYESWMFEGFDRVVLLTAIDAQKLNSLNPDLPTVVIPNGVDVEAFSSTGYEPDDPTLLFLGNYDYAPNLDAAMRLVRDIFPRILHAEPEVRLYLVGSHPPPELRAYASAHIEITGRVPDIRPYFEYSKIFISPLQLGAGIKNKILEALAMQTPVVATPLSCDGIPVEHGQHVMLGETNDDLVKLTLQLLSNEKLRYRLRLAGRQLVQQQFTWSRVADQYEQLYRQLLDEYRYSV